jgi:heme/copper-type cytochrome/quinol oxidase subunit 2
MLAWLLAQTHDAAEEGRNIIMSMLVVGLIFISVIALGETSKWLRHRRRRHR